MTFKKTSIRLNLHKFSLQIFLLFFFIMPPTVKLGKKFERNFGEESWKIVENFIKEFGLKRRKSELNINSWRFNLAVGKKKLPVEIVSKYESLEPEVPIYIMRFVQTYKEDDSIGTLEITFYPEYPEISNIHRNEDWELKGSVVLDLAIEIVKWFGFKEASLTDVSHVDCAEGEEYYSLALFQMFKEGKTWYEKKGFKFTPHKSTISDKKYEKIKRHALSTTIKEIFR